MVDWDNLDDNSEPENEDTLDELLTEIIVEHISRENLQTPEFEIYKSILVDMFVNADINCTEISRAYIFGIMDYTNIRYLMTLSLITNAFHSLEVGLRRPDKQYLQTSKRILEDLDELFNGKDRYVEILITDFDRIVRMCKNIMFEKDSRISDRFTFSDFFLADYNGSLFVDYFEFQKNIAMDESTTIYTDTSRPIKSTSSRFVLEFIKTYHNMSGRRPTDDLLQLAIYSANCYDISNHLLLHELLKEEINAYVDDDKPIPLQSKRKGYSEDLLKAGVIENLNAICELYRNEDTPTVAQESSLRNSMLQKLAIDMETLKRHFQYTFGFMPLKVSDVALYADAYYFTVNAIMDK